MVNCVKIAPLHGNCLMSTFVGWSHVGDKLPREIENPLYRYLIAISKLRLGILTEQLEGS